MGRIVERSRALLDGPAAGAASASTPPGQLFLEEYYTLGVIGKAGLGTPHMDGNTRLCTATAAAALKAVVRHGRPARLLHGLDHCDTIALWGHNVAETQTVLWMRMLDRRAGPTRRGCSCVDPRPRRSRARPTSTSRRAPAPTWR